MTHVSSCYVKRPNKMTNTHSCSLSLSPSFSPMPCLLSDEAQGCGGGATTIGLCFVPQRFHVPPLPLVWCHCSGVKCDIEMCAYMCMLFSQISVCVRVCSFCAAKIPCPACATGLTPLCRCEIYVCVRACMCVWVCVVCQCVCCVSHGFHWPLPLVWCHSSGVKYACMCMFFANFFCVGVFSFCAAKILLASPAAGSMWLFKF